MTYAPFPPSSRLSHRSFFPACALLAGALSSLPAATWDGGLSHNNFTANDLWSTPNNWVEGVAPTPSATTDIVFALSGIRTTANQNVNAAFNVRNLTFAAGSNVTALTGNPLTFVLGSRLIQNSSTNVRIAQALNFDTSLASTSFISGSGSGRLTVEGSITAYFLQIMGTTGSASTSLPVTLAGSNSMITLLIGGTAGGVSPVDVTLAHNEVAGLGSIGIVSGNTLRTNGTSRTLGNALFFSTQPGNGLPVVHTIGAGGDLVFEGEVDLRSGTRTLQVDNASTTFSGQLLGLGLLTKAGAGTLVLNHPGDGFFGVWTVNAGKLDIRQNGAAARSPIVLNIDHGLVVSGISVNRLGGLSGSGALALGSTELIVGNTSFPEATYSGTISSASPTAGTVRAQGAQHTLALSGTSSFGTLIAETGLTRLTGAKLTLGSSVTVGAASGTVSGRLLLQDGAKLTLPSSGVVNVLGPAGTELAVTGANASLEGGNRILVSGTGADTAYLRVSAQGFAGAGLLAIGSGAGSGPGAMEVLDGGDVFSLGGVIGQLAGATGTVRLSGSGSSWQTVRLDLGGLAQAATGAVGRLTVEPGASMTATGLIVLWTAASRIDVAGGKLFAGSLQTAVAGATVALSDPDETLSALEVGSDGTSTAFAGILTNSTAGPGGLTKIGSGTLILNGSLSYTGRTRVQAGKLAVPQSNLYATVLEVTGGTFEFQGVWGSNGISQTVIGAGGRVTGNGTLRGSLRNDGLIDASGTQGLVLSGPVENNGRIRLAAGASLTATQTLTNHGVLDLITAGAVNVPNLVNTGRLLDRHSLQPFVKVASGGAMQVSASGFAGHTYRLQRSATLSGGAFADLGAPVVLNADGPLTFLDQTPPAGQAFYRIKVD